MIGPLNGIRAWVLSRDPNLAALRRAGRARDRDADDVRDRRQGARQPDLADLRRVRLVRDAAAGRLHAARCATRLAVAGGARGSWARCSSCVGTLASRSTLAGRRRDGCRRASRSSSPASSARCSPARRPRCCSRSSCRCRCPRRCPPSRTGSSAGAGRGRSLLAIVAALAGPDGGPAARSRGRAPAALSPRGSATTPIPPLGRRERRRGRTRRAVARGRAAPSTTLQPDVPRDAVPADRAEHGGAHGRPPRRRAHLARRDRRAVAARPAGTHADGSRRARCKSAAAAVLDRAADLLEARLGPTATGLLEALARACATGSTRRVDDAPRHGRPAAETTTAADRRSSSAARPELPGAGARASRSRRSRGTPSSPPPPSGAAGPSGCSAASRRSRRAPLSAAQERAAAHVERHSVWLHNSLRGAAGLGARRARRQPVRGPALVLGRARHPVGAALQRTQHRPERRARPAGDHRRGRPRSAAADADRHRHHGPVGAAAARRSWSPGSRPRPSRSRQDRPAFTLDAA